MKTWSWSWPSECISFWRWFSWSWSIRKGWDGPYVILRELGWRFCGLEHVRIARFTSNDY